MEILVNKVAELLTEKVRKVTEDTLMIHGMEQALTPLQWLIMYAIKAMLRFLLHEMATVAYRQLDVTSLQNKAIYIFKKMFGRQPAEVITV